MKIIRYIKEMARNVRGVDIRCPMRTRFRPNARQPRAVFKGPAFVEIKGDMAILT